MKKIEKIKTKTSTQQGHDYSMTTLLAVAGMVKEYTGGLPAEAASSCCCLAESLPDPESSQCSSISVSVGQLFVNAGSL